MAQQKTRSGCLVAIIVGGIILAVGVALTAAFLFMGVRSIGIGVREWNAKSDEGGVDEYPNLEKTWSYGEGDTPVVRIPIYGVLTRTASGGILGEVSDPVGDVLACIQDATKDEEVMAIILEVDSPGGEVTASDVIYRALLKFKQAKKGRKVVALFEDVAASGAYYIAMAADHIVAQPTTITGSIGVLISTMNFKGLGDKLGVEDVTIKSGANKDMLNPLRTITPEERAIIQGVVDDTYARFVSLVVKGRELPEATVRELADGRIMTARQALEAQLVDSIGYWDDAVKVAGDLMDLPAVKVYKYEPQRSIWDFLKVSSGSAEQLKRLLEPRPAKLMYLWNS
ncbi:MAG: signal peptide peptidase SppA [Kiritimatiellia bacterium]